MSQKIVMVIVGIKFSNKAIRGLASPSSCGILGCRAVTSMVHNIDKYSLLQCNAHVTLSPQLTLCPILVLQPRYSAYGYAWLAAHQQ